MLNKYIWKNYLESGGSEVVELFRKKSNCDYAEDYVRQVCRMISGFCPMRVKLDDIKDQLSYLFGYYQTNEEGSASEYEYGNMKDNGMTDDEIVQFILDLEYNKITEQIAGSFGKDASEKDVFRVFIGNLYIETTACFHVIPELFVPYYFQHNFNVLQIIAQEFEISIPPIPLKKNYKERFYYYGELCKAFTEFRKVNDLSPYELCAFLYDFAPNYIGGTDSYIIEDLPEPERAFFIGGSEKDEFLSDDPSAMTAWQCNEDTRAGDIILMYLRSPVSAVDSVWRACSVGFTDPFFFYYRCTWISRPIRITHVTQQSMKDDPIIGNLPIVRKNMQGINGVELLPSEYNHLMDMAHAEVFRFVSDDAPRETMIMRERDVEDQLIKPLLISLGYSDDLYTQQLYIEIGNHNHALIPDFVLLPRRSSGHA